MSELKKIRVREAKIRDKGLFRKLWMELLQKQEKEGSIIKPSAQTMEVYDLLFEAYLEGKFEGIVLFVADRGVLMCGDAASPFDYHAGRMLTFWGVFTTSDEDKSIQSALMNHVVSWAKEHSFDGILVDSFKDSVPMEGFEPVSTVQFRPLNVAEVRS